MRQVLKDSPLWLIHKGLLRDTGFCLARYFDVTTLSGRAEETAF
jgi:hypothetical protein